MKMGLAKPDGFIAPPHLSNHCRGTDQHAECRGVHFGQPCECECHKDEVRCRHGHFRETNCECFDGDDYQTGYADGYEQGRRDALAEAQRSN